MRSQSLINNMMQPSPLSDFNPLDVLAAAASLQSARIEPDAEQSDPQSPLEVESDNTELNSQSDEKTESSEKCDDCEKQNVPEPAAKANDDAVFQTPTIKNIMVFSSKMPTKPVNKPVTVLRVCKPQISDHSYAYMFQLSLKHDEDEGYSSRSSIDEEGEDVSLQSASPPDRSPTTPTVRRHRIKEATDPDSAAVQTAPNTTSVPTPDACIATAPVTTPVASAAPVADSDVSNVADTSVAGTLEESTAPVTTPDTSVAPVATPDASVAPVTTPDVPAALVTTPDELVDDATIAPSTDVAASDTPLSADSDSAPVSLQDTVALDTYEGTAQDTETVVSLSPEDILDPDGCVEQSNASTDEAEMNEENSQSSSESNCETNSDTAVAMAVCDDVPVSGSKTCSSSSSPVAMPTDVHTGDAEACSQTALVETVDTPEAKHQYIIEDDVNPVSKFSAEEVKDISEGVMLVSSPRTSVLSLHKQSLLKTSKANSVVHVIPVVSGGRVTQILNRPVQYLAAIPQKTVVKVHAQPSPQPSLGKLLMPVSPITPFSKGVVVKSPAAPVNVVSAPSTPSDSPEKSPNLKVTQNADSDLMEDRSVKVEKKTIGTVGSLSWKALGGSLRPLGGNKNKEFIRIQGSQIQSRETSEGESEAPTSPNPWAGTTLELGYSMDDILSVTNSDDSLQDALSETASLNSPLPLAPKRKKGDKEVWEQTSELHPLIDHDYCMFTEFNAQIQSSIIATTETKTRIDRRYNKKSKAARTKAATIVQTDKPTRGRPAEKVLKGRKGRLKKKDVNRNITVAEESYSPDSADQKPAVHSKESEEKALKRQARLERKMLAEKKKAERDKRNFVKITGSYQDDFVYYATRNYRGRPRKAPEPLPDLGGKPAKPIPAGGVNDFDWYRDLSKTDKTSCFGSPGIQSTESSRHASPAAVVLQEKVSIPGSTPIHESDVVDLVCELSGIGASSFTEVTTEKEDSHIDINQMAEDVCSMLTSLDENGLRMLEKLGEDSVDEKPAGLADSSFDGFLPAPGQSQLCDDLDEINDNDLLSTDISNMNDMNDILTDLRSSAGATTTTDTTCIQAGGSTLSLVPPVGTNPFTEKLDRAELFPDVHTPSPSRSDTVAPELTVVSMFWNDLPGLMIGGVQHVRLVDIHKQVLPAKDTGILKKRCQMMGLDIQNCSELQRDFLIRYANAAKSKSTVIVNKQAAEELIGFYVNPKPRTARQAAEDKEDVKCIDEPVSPVMEEPVVTEDPAPATPLAPPSLSDETQHSRGGKRGRKRKLTGESEGPLSPCPPDTQTLPAHDLKRSERLRHKKVRYADMANGTGLLEGEEEEEATRIPTTRTPTRSPAGRAPACAPTAPILDQDDSASSDHENRDITHKIVFPEQLEIKKLRLKARKKRLSKQEKRRLKRLKERLQKKERKRKLLEKKKKLVDQQRGGRGKKRLQETHAFVKGNPEHCYAACPALKDKKEAQVVEEDVVQVQEGGKAPLAVVHRDNVHRGTGRVGRWQDGEVHLYLYRSKDSACIQCMTCRDFYSVRHFLKHMHKQNNPDELLVVNLPQKFELRNPSPTDGEAQDWQEFQTRRHLVELSPNDRNRKSPKADSESVPSGTDVTKEEHGEAEKEVNVEIHVKSLKGGDKELEDSSTRHSTRVRKRKQLHPIESYVYSKLLPANQPEKREELQGEIDKVSMAVSPIRATKLKVSVKKDGGSPVVTRLDLKVASGRPTKRSRLSE